MEMYKGRSHTKTRVDAKTPDGRVDGENMSKTKKFDKVGNKPFRVLSIDGGGVRGIFAAKILSLMETRLQINTHETFDLIVGTSTGSIIAAAIARKYDLNQLVEDYSENASKIFQKRWTLCGLLTSKYDSKFLANFLRRRLGKITLGEIEKPLILNATNASVGDVYVFKSSYQKRQRKGDYVRDAEIPLYKAVLASCSAPTYFDPIDINGTLVCDGGIWANNPSLVGYTDAINNFQAENIKILSLGTGKARYVYQPARRWGFLTGWKKTKLVDFLMSCQTKFPQNVLSLIDRQRVLRIDVEIENYALDDHQNMITLKELAKNEFTKRNAEIKDFLHIGGANNET